MDFNEELFYRGITDGVLDARVLEINPELATKMLELNTSNRKVSKAYVKSYAEDMRNGKWLLNGQSISFDEEGKLQDGQHRLLAIIESGCSIAALVTFGMPVKSFSTIDIGRHRNLSQILSIQGVKNTKTISIIVTNYNQIVNNKLYFRTCSNCISVGGDFKNNISDLNDIFYQYEEIFVHYGNTNKKYYDRMAGKYPISVYLISAIMVYLEINKGYDRDFIRQFFDSIINFDGCSNTTLNSFRLQMLRIRDKMLINRYTPDKKRIYFLITKVWNLYASGIEKNVLHFNFNRLSKEIEFLHANDIIK